MRGSAACRVLGIAVEKIMNDPQATPDQPAQTTPGQRPEEALDEQVQAEEAAAPEESGDAAAEVAEPPPSAEERVSALEAEVAKRDDALLRLQAESDNARKRAQRDVENAHKFALERFIAALLPVRDSMEMGLRAVDDNTDVAKLREGAELTLKLMADVMAKFNVVQIDPEGEPFNPELHQAMSMVARDDLPPNTVVTVVQKGYTLNDRLVRPAMVMVSSQAQG